MLVCVCDLIRVAEAVRAELAAATERARTIELHNDELKSKLSVQKRVVSKASTEQERMEQEKQQQVHETGCSNARICTWTS